jgi:hypothetical protein
MPQQKYTAELRKEVIEAITEGDRSAAQVGVPKKWKHQPNHQYLPSKLVRKQCSLQKMSKTLI